MLMVPSPDGRGAMMITESGKCANCFNSIGSMYVPLYTVIR